MFIGRPISQLQLKFFCLAIGLILHELQVFLFGQGELNESRIDGINGYQSGRTGLYIGTQIYVIHFQGTGIRGVHDSVIEVVFSDLNLSLVSLVRSSCLFSCRRLCIYRLLGNGILSRQGLIATQVYLCILVGRISISCLGLCLR